MCIEGIHNNAIHPSRAQRSADVVNHCLQPGRHVWLCLYGSYKTRKPNFGNGVVYPEAFSLKVHL